MAQRENSESSERTVRRPRWNGTSPETEARLTELLDRIRAREDEFRKQRPVFNVSDQLRHEVMEMQAVLKRTIDERDELERENVRLRTREVEATALMVNALPYILKGMLV